MVADCLRINPTPCNLRVAINKLRRAEPLFDCVSNLIARNTGRGLAERNGTTMGSPNGQVRLGIRSTRRRGV